MKLLRNLAIILLTGNMSVALVRGAPAEAPVTPSWDLTDHPDRIALFAAIALVLAAGTGVLLFFAARKPEDAFIFKLRASFFFWLGIGYTLVLMLAAIVYNVSYHDNRPYLIGGILPIAVPWFGALGAVTISLEGVFLWSHRHWNPDYNYWHLGRPVFGAVLGIIAFFLFVLIILSSGTVPDFIGKPGEPGSPKDFIIYYVVAFLVGYREETFRELIRRVTDMILKPGLQSTDVPTVSFKNAGVTLSEIKFPEVAVGSQAQRQTIEILNSGKAPLVAPTVIVNPADSASKAVFDKDNDNLTGINQLDPNQTKTVDITFSPGAAGAYSGILSVTATNLTMPATIRITGIVR
jgi:hypothetical protein